MLQRTRDHRDPILSLRGVSASYGLRQVLFDINLVMGRRERLAIRGGNGSGKSTLLHVIYGLHNKAESVGEIDFYPDPLAAPIQTACVRENLRHGLGLLPQSRALFDSLTGYENLVAAASILPRRQIRDRFSRAFEAIPEVLHLLRKPCASMSGGERKLLSIAMLLIHRPTLVLLDEPLAGLDQNHAERVVMVLRHLAEAGEVSMLIVEHRASLIEELVDRVVDLKGGIVTEGK